ncbi:MAG: asparaginase [Gemmatimonadaceae bacterium]|nr:asparaginase [Gemmatimonadaceae bacterium]
MRSLALLPLVVGTCIARAPLAHAQRPTAPLPRVLVIATGGTIAGTQDRPGTTAAYRAGQLTAPQLLASVPGLDRIAQVETEQFANVPSTWITPEQWLALSRRVNAVLRDRPDLAGVVITHGTSRLEETAFFLHCTVRSDRPVVLVGAQRPATGLSADGPVNLLGAIRTAASPLAAGKGVIVTLDDRLVSARDVRKQYARVGGFGDGEMGMLGVVTNDGPVFFYAPARRFGRASEFDVGAIDSLPTVELHASYVGNAGPRMDDGALPAGIVVAGTGFTRGEGDAYRALRQRGVVVATAFPSGDQVDRAAPREEAELDTLAPPATALDSLRALERRAPPLVATQHLTPAKARILLMLALTRTREPRAVQRIFAEY